MINNLSNKKLLEENDLDLYTALSIFVNRAPKIIDGILDAAESENLTETEELAAKLITYSDNAQLVGFTEKLKNLVIAAREHKLFAIEKHADLLKQSFEQMVKLTGTTGIEQRIELEQDITCQPFTASN